MDDDENIEVVLADDFEFQEPPVEVLGRLILQSDFDEALREPDGKAWISYKSHGKPSVYGELQSSGVSEDGVPYVTPSDGFRVDKVTQKLIKMQYEIAKYDVIIRTFLAPHSTIKTVHTPGKSIHCLDVAPGGLGVSSDSEGKLKIWETETGEVRRVLEGHLGDVYTCKMFPSGIVALSGGADMQLKIWSAETGKCAATMRGHKASILDTCIIDRGRNIVSCGKDGTAKLWDCGTQKCLHTYEGEAGIVNSCDTGQMLTGHNIGSPDEPTSEREVGTQRKALILGCDNKTVVAYGLNTKKKIWDVTHKIFDAVTSCSFVSPIMFLVGQQDGHMTIFDIRNPERAVVAWRETRGPVLSVMKYKSGYLASTGDGSCHFITHPNNTQVEMTGPDCDPVYSTASDGRYLYTACRDSIIRKYDTTGIIREGYC